MRISKIVRRWKTERLRKSEKHTLKDEKRSRMEGGKQRQPENLKDREATQELHILLGGSFPPSRWKENKIPRCGSAEGGKDRLETGTQEF